MDTSVHSNATGISTAAAAAAAAAAGLHDAESVGAGVSVSGGLTPSWSRACLRSGLSNDGDMWWDRTVRSGAWDGSDVHAGPCVASPLTNTAGNVHSQNAHTLTIAQHVLLLAQNSGGADKVGSAMHERGVDSSGMRVRPEHEPIGFLPTSSSRASSSVAGSTSAQQWHAHSGHSNSLNRDSDAFKRKDAFVELFSQSFGGEVEDLVNAFMPGCSKVEGQRHVVGLRSLLGTMPDLNLLLSTRLEQLKALRDGTAWCDEHLNVGRQQGWGRCSVVGGKYALYWILDAVNVCLRGAAQVLLIGTCPQPPTVAHPKAPNRFSSPQNPDPSTLPSTLYPQPSTLYPLHGRCSCSTVRSQACSS
jgi:hypothetical protein